EWGAHELVDTQRFDSCSRANHIDHRVHRAHFMEVNGLDINVVNLRFGSAESLENRACICPGSLRQPGAGDDLLDLSQTTAMSVRLNCFSRGPMMMIVVVLVMLTMLMRVLVSIPLLGTVLFPEHFTR